MIHKLLLTALVCTSFSVGVQADDERPARPAIPAPAPSPAPPSPLPPISPPPTIVPAPDQAPTPRYPQRRNKGQLSEDQRNLMAELRAKYDANKDGMIDATERKAMTVEDKERLAKNGFIARKKRDRDDNN